MRCTGTVLRFLGAWLGALVTVLMRWTSRVNSHNDPRPALRAANQPYAYAFLHAHQVATVIAGEPGTGAMVSRSADGDLLVPALRARGIIPVRGSSKLAGKRKGGRAALENLIEHSRNGAPAYFAVDGPRGPRNQVRRGVAELAFATGAAILPVVGLPRRRWILSRTWDRFQIPKPFPTIDIWYDEPLLASDAADIDALRCALSARLDALEILHDPEEAGIARGGMGTKSSA